MKPPSLKTLGVFVLWLSAAAHAENISIRPYLEISGKQADARAVQVRRSNFEIAAAFTAPQAGTYQFGISVCASAISPLAPGQTSYTPPSLTQPLVLRYPYDWTAHDNKNILNSRSRLVIPGIVADQLFYVADTHELFSVTLVAESAQVCAHLLAHRFFNDGNGDRATPELRMSAGEQREFVVRIYPSIKAVNEARLGEHHQEMQGWVTQPPFREWAERSFTPDEYTETARKLEGAFQYVIVREVKSENWVPPIFHQRGIKAIHYQYIGALRRFTPQVTPEIERDTAMRDAQGRMMTAPIPLKGNWMLADIRRLEVRTRFVENARNAIAAGFDGVFLDGYPFWNDASGDYGGSAPAATESWAYARWQLLHEIKEAIHAQNPQATFGVLANNYYDSLGEADWVARERMYMAWENNKDFGAQATKIRQDLDVAFEEDEPPYLSVPLLYGVKGYSPIGVQSALHFIRHPTGFYYTDDSDFPAAQLDPWLDTERSVVTQKDLYITAIQPADCWVHFEDRATIRTTENCTVKFSRPVCVTRHSDKLGTGGMTELIMEPEVHYDLASSCPAPAASATAFRKVEKSATSEVSANTRHVGSPATR